MEDTVQPSAEEYHAAYVASFRLWSGLLHQAKANPTLPPSALSLKDALPRQPRLSSNVAIKHTKYKSHSRSSVKGFSEWTCSASSCGREMPTFRQSVNIEISVQDPITLSIGQVYQDGGYFETWFSRNHDNYISILVLAWAYVLSARWCELVPHESSITYTDNQASERNGADAGCPEIPMTKIFLGACSPEEFRWWAAVLAPGTGWKAGMVVEHEEVLAPWSTSLEHGVNLTISGSQAAYSSFPEQTQAASFAEAFGFLARFCSLHDIEDQSLAALAAAILLPSQPREKVMSLPAIKTSCTKQEALSKSCTLMGDYKTLPGGRMLPQCIPQRVDLDRLLTFSCYTMGIQSVIMNAFFNPIVECNKSGPWIQGLLDVLNPLLESESWILGRIMMDRLPEAAPLWLGITIFGLQSKFVRQIGFGQVPISLHAATWSGTVQSFMQVPCSDSYRQNGWVPRADECKILFLCQALNHTRLPVCPWAPFGTTPLEDTDVDVRIHQNCTDHILQYKGFIWECVEGDSCSERLVEMAAQDTPKSSAAISLGEFELDLPGPGALAHTKEFISEVWTRNIFSWLRSDGYARHEKEIWQHEWLDIGECDDEEEEEEEDTQEDESDTKPHSHVSSWVRSLASQFTEDE